MSELRKQLDSEKAKYRAARYPGDLASDVIGRGRGNWWIGALGAVAASIAVALSWYAQPNTITAPLGKTNVVLATNKSRPADDSIWTPPHVATVSMSDVGGMPSFGTATPSLGPMPSFPSISDARGE